MLRRFAILCVLAAMLLTLGSGVALGAYPEKEITLVVQAAPGGASDFVARTMAQYAAPLLGTRFNVVNRTGGSGAVGMSVVMNSKPDGYTIGYVPVELSMLKYLGYAQIDPSNFDLIMRANILPAALTVRADSPYKSVNDFIKAGKANPGKLAIGNAGPGSIWHLAAAAMEDETGITVKHIPFDGAAPAIAALLGGNVDAVTVSVMEVLPNVKAGKLRVLGVMDRSRSSLLPDVPTFKELGYDVQVMAWGGFAVPKGTPADIRQKIHDAFKAAYQSEGFQKAFADRGVVPGYLPPEEFREFAEQQSKMFGRLFNRLGLAK